MDFEEYVFCKRNVYLFFMLLQFLFSSPSLGHTHYYDFVVESATYTRLCSTKEILTVNGKFPGPTLYARKGDTMVVNVCNQASENVTVHWHGANLPRNPWSDGPAYITQCPIKPGKNFSYMINLSDEEGTIWWHAHTDWIRATVHGAIIVYPELGSCYPFPKPHKEYLLILGEWWKKNLNELKMEVSSGMDPTPSDAYTINGQPGDLYPCSKQETIKFQVEQGYSYLFRAINVGLNNALFLSIANHTVTIVGSDGSYLKPILTDYIVISPGETLDLLLEADQLPNQNYYIAARSLNYKSFTEFDSSTTTAILTYNNYNQPILPSLPSYDDTESAINFTSRLKILDPPKDLPQSIDEHFLVTVSLNKIEQNLAASLNNISLHVATSIDVLEAYYNMIRGVFGVYFPNYPPHYYNFTADVQPDSLLLPKVAEEVHILEYAAGVEVVLQGTSLVIPQDHPMHLHGYSFYVVGWGLGNFDKDKDPSRYNLVNPPLKNTISIPRNGWVAIRFKADNPGVWYLHCHVESHLVWGMGTIFIVKNGKSPESKMLPPPSYMPPC